MVYRSVNRSAMFGRPPLRRLGVLAASFSYGVVRTWQTDLPADTGRSSKVSEMQVNRLVFSPDGQRLAAITSDHEKEARLWTVDGAGSAVSLHAGGGLIAELAVSPGGRWIVTTNDRQGAQLHPLDVNLALTPFRNSPVCLSAARRQRYLLESSGTAQTRYEACEAKQRVADAAAQR